MSSRNRGKDKIMRRRSDSLIGTEKGGDKIARSLSLPEKEEFAVNVSQAPEEKKNQKIFGGLGRGISRLSTIPNVPINLMNSKASSDQESNDSRHPRPYEKERLLELLEQFFSIDGNDYRYDDLFDDYEWAVESDCLASYDQLLLNLYNSSLRFDEFAVVYSDNGQGNTLCVEFRDQENFDDPVDQPLAAASPSTATVDESEINKLISQVRSSSTNQNSKRLLENEVAEMRRDMIVYKSMVQFNHKELQTKYQDLYAKYNSNTKRVLDHYSAFREDIIALKSEVHRKQEIIDVDIMSLPEDAFSFLMYRPFGLPSIAALIVFVLQMTTYFLTISNNFIPTRESDFERIPFIDVPLGVTLVVHAGQGIAIALIFLVNDGLWESSMQLLNGYNKDLKEHNITYYQWFVSNLLRFVEGISASIVLFFLIVQSDNIVELFKDFTAMTFISSLDNVVYQLAEMNVIGVRMKEATEICEIEVHTRKESSKTDDVVKKSTNFLRHPATMNGLWLMTIYIMWLTIGVIPQINGDYLCQSIFIQLDDDVNPKLSYFSGTYKIQKGGLKKNFFTTSYIEVKKSLDVKDEDRRPIILRFCQAEQNWIFTFLDAKDECDGFRFIESSTMSDQQQYDLFNVPQDSWYVSEGNSTAEGEDTRFLPLRQVFMTCVDRDDDVLTLANDNCPDIEIDERKEFGPFIGTRSWSSKFHRLSIKKDDEVEYAQVYNRPVYYSANTQLDEIEVVLFTGKRWMMTSSLFIFKPNEKDVPIDITNPNTGKSDHEIMAVKLQEEFHAYHSYYHAAFFSEAVTFDTPKDSGIPTSLKWYSATSDVKPKADLKREESSIFICSACDDNSNKCFYSNECINNVCECSNGSEGTLCQVLPSSDGRCNTFFNEQIYDFDGGDCCIHSCKSKDGNVCGRDENSYFYTGYDLCRNSNGPHVPGNKVSFQDVSPAKGDIYQVYQVSLSSNGRIMASIDSRTLSVRVYDNDGADWIMRGTAVATVNDLLTDSVEISSYVGYVNTLGSLLSPATLAVKSAGQVRIFDWIVNTWVDHSCDLLRNTTVLVKEALLRNDGKTFGVLLNNGTFTIFHRSTNDAKWYVKDSVKGTDGHEKYTFAALSYNGNSYLLANRVAYFVHHENKRHVLEIVRPNDKINAVAMSSNGLHIALLIEYQPKKAQVTLLNLEDGVLRRTHNSLRGLGAEGITVSLFDDGLHLAIHSDITKDLLFYSIMDNDGIKNWDKANALNEEVRKMTFSRNEKVLAVIPESKTNMGDSLSSLQVYNVIADCPQFYTNVHVTFALDNSQRALSWEVRHMTSPQNDTILANGGPYDLGEVTITDNFCLPTEFVSSTVNEESNGYNPSNGCVYIKIRDLELDGLKSPGRIGITVNGTVYWNKTVTDGFEDTFIIFGDRSCLDSKIRRNPWGERNFDTSLQNICRTKNCIWELAGDTLKSFTSFGIYVLENIIISQPLSMSSDGAIIALNELKNDTFGNVNVLEFKDETWNMIGSSIKGNNTDQFGFSKSLSADGWTVAIGSPNSKNNGFKSGQVSIYCYDRINSEWHPKGNVINGPEGSQSGWSVKLSADGSIVAIGTGTVDQKCHAHVYEFDEMTADWIQKGDCLDALLGHNSYMQDLYLFNNFPVDLSSNGRVVAIGSPMSDINDIVSGQVVVYEFNDVLDKWLQRGPMISDSTIFAMTGASVSLSANGDIIAVGGVINSDVIVYQYLSDDNKWEKFGSSVKTQGPADKGTVEVALTSDGRGLTVSTMLNYFTYVYDDTTFVWIQNFITTRDLNNTYYSWFSMSADGMTIAAATSEQNDVNVWKLKSIETDNTCSDKEHSFNLTITPDRFPKDLAWVLYDSEGTVIIGGFIPETEEGTPTHIYEQCMQKTNSLYTFSIYDFYGDGICCEWGIGHFSVNFNSEVVLTNENFQKVSFVCIPYVDVELLTVRIKQDTNTEGPIKWNLFDRNSMVADETTVINPFIYGICQKVKYCYTFALKNVDRTRVQTTILFGKKREDLNSTNRPLSVARIGQCADNNTTACSNGNTTLELSFFPDEYVQELSWVVLDAKGAKVESSVGITHIYGFQQFSYCLPESHPCLTLILLDSWGDAGPAYQASWKKQLIEGITSVSIEKLYFGNSTECARPMACEDGFAVFDIEFISSQYYGLADSWFELKNEQDEVFGKGKAEARSGEYRREQICLPLPTSSSDPNKCWTFFRRDENVKLYQITWNGTVVKKRANGGFEVPFFETPKPLSFGQC